MKILCIIPARSGSKGIPNKNIKLFKGKPLIAWSIEQAKKSKYNMKIIVSTDSKNYATIAKKWGAEVPFLRPVNISSDFSNDYECIKHVIEWLKTHSSYKPDIILHLRPTQPLRKIEDINKCLDLFIQHREKYDSLRTIIPFEKSPFKMYTINNTILKPLFNKLNNINEPFNECRQILPQTYIHNGYIDILNTSILKRNTISGNNIYPYIMSKHDIHDIDTLNDWEKAELYSNI